jgi:hypothetical protein
VKPSLLVKLPERRQHQAQDLDGSCSFAYYFFLLGLQLPMGVAVLRECNHQPSRRLQALNVRVAGYLDRRYGLVGKFLKKLKYAA